MKKLLPLPLSCAICYTHDLMGSLIGFYIACGEMTQEEASELCGKLPTSISLQLKKEGKFKMSNSLIPKYRIVNENNKPIFPAKLTEYNSLNEPKNYITPLEETETITFLGTDISQK